MGDSSGAGAHNWHLWNINFDPLTEIHNLALLNGYPIASFTVYLVNMGILGSLVSKYGCQSFHKENFIHVVFLTIMCISSKYFLRNDTKKSDLQRNCDEWILAWHFQLFHNSDTYFSKLNFFLPAFTEVPFFPKNLLKWKQVIFFLFCVDSFYLNIHTLYILVYI